MKKSRSYLIIFGIGIALVCVGIFNVVDSINENDKSKIFIRSIIFFFWLLFTISNFYLYKKEIKKTKP